MELSKKLEFIQVKEAKKELLSASIQKFINKFKEAVEQVNLAKKGKIKLKSAEELSSEL